MSTSTRSRSSRTKAEATEPTPEPTPEATEPTPEVTKKVYRDNPDFGPALKSAKSLSRGNIPLGQAIQLITHLAWKTPSSSVGWSKGTTPNVIAYADDLAVPVGTPIADAMAVALNAAERSVEGDAQRDSVAVLAEVIRQHG